MNRCSNQVLRYHGTTGLFVGAFVAAGANELSAPAGLAFSRDGDFHEAPPEDLPAIGFDKRP
jgi:hypothetical protein